MNTKSILMLFVGTLILAGCAQQTKQEFTTAGPVTGLQIAVGDCMVVPPPLEPKTQDSGTRDLLAAGAAAAISQGVNYLGRAATAAGESKTWKIQGARNFQTPENQFPKCIQVVRGRFLSEGASDNAWNPPKKSGWPSETKTYFAARGLYLPDMPDFLFEGQIVPSLDKSTFAIRPGIATYLAPIDTRFLRPSKKRNIALFFALTTPGTKPTLDDNPGATLTLGALQPGSTRKYAVNDKTSSPYESAWFSVRREDAVKPLTLSVLMTETQGEQAFLTFMGSLLSDPKVVAAANADLSNRLIRPVRETNENDAAVKENDAIVKRNAAFVTVQAKLEACAKSTDSGDIRKAAEEAAAAMATYDAEDRKTRSPYGDLSPSMLNPKDKPRNVKSMCKKLFDQFSHD
ncbi:hypothetical protein [Pseudomonas chlororaphis]|uniref:hypothetical protein n=1 Tax=Pseudomonas chlororaphis TaxID=587753 RepID=UPI000D0EB16C|nr:hypothetical protein [Pseudomonas chlororaphis]AVO58914.1 hypothetical protein C6Q18_13425 [Pseudomonas chlororaphis subsp. piscium]